MSLRLPELQSKTLSYRARPRLMVTEEERERGKGKAKRPFLLLAALCWKQIVPVPPKPRNTPSHLSQNVSH